MKSGQMKVVAVGRDQRVPIYPDIPTMAESGYPAVSLKLWFALVGPKGMRTEVVDRINQAVRAVLTDPAFLEASPQKDVDYTSLSGAALRQYIQRETAKVSELAKSRGIRLEQ